MNVPLPPIDCSCVHHPSYVSVASSTIPPLTQSTGPLAPTVSGM